MIQTRERRRHGRIRPRVRRHQSLALHLPSWDKEEYATKLKALNKQLKGSHSQKRSFATGLGSWVAGPSADDSSGYNRSGDDVSNNYFKNIGEGLSVTVSYTHQTLPTILLG